MDNWASQPNYTAAVALGRIYGRARATACQRENREFHALCAARLLRLIQRLRLRALPTERYARSHLLHCQDLARIRLIAVAGGEPLALWIPAALARIKADEGTDAEYASWAAAAANAVSDVLHASDADQLLPMPTAQGLAVRMRSDIVLTLMDISECTNLAMASPSGDV